jgi:hypothetical protein
MTFKDFLYVAAVLAIYVLVAYLCAKYIGFWSAAFVIFGGLAWVAWPKSNPPMHIDE